MTTLDDRILPLALNLIAKFGKAATVYDAYTDVDVATGRTSTVPDSWSVTIAPPSPVNSKYVNGDIVIETDMQTMIAASGLAFTPSVGMRVVFDSTDYKVVAAQPLYSGESIAAWRLIARR